MTVVIAVKVFDGIVLASDSATTIELKDLAGKIVDHQVYNNADKIFHLHRDIPIGLATWGAGHIESASISALAKDLRRRLMRPPSDDDEWALDKDSYTIEDVAEKVLRFFHDELLSQGTEEREQPTGLLLAGYSAGQRRPEVWEMILERLDVRPEPIRVLGPDESGWRASGQPVAVSRLIEGIGPGLKEFVRSLLPEDKKAAFEAFLSVMEGPTVVPSMPFADAIDFARMCAEVTISYTRFTPGSDTVGGSIDIAAISQYEGFKWVQRKHYYPADLNPRRPHDHDQ